MCVDQGQHGDGRGGGGAPHCPEWLTNELEALVMEEEEEINMAILYFAESWVTIKVEQTCNIMNRIQITLEYSKEYF